jgi:hypothetical protein
LATVLCTHLDLGKWPGDFDQTPPPLFLAKPEIRLSDISTKRKLVRRIHPNASKAS